MYTSPTLTTDEFKRIHNALCSLDSLTYSLEDVLNSQKFEVLSKAKEEIRGALQRAYQEDNRVFDTRNAHYASTKNLMNLKHSEWSIYEVDDMRNPHQFSGIDRVVYDNHCGEKPVSASVQGNTWMALWSAADECIKNSGDSHHVFIEAFHPSKEDPRTLLLITGS